MLAARKSSRRQPDLERARQIADALRAEQELRHPTEAPIEDLAWLLKATVHDVPLEGTEGRLVTSPESDPVIEVSTRIRYQGQRRFVIAHELGHLLLHADRNESRIWDGTATRDRAKEREADIWASNWLMPYEMWQPRVGAGVIPIQTLDELIDEYRVSLHAATIRVVELTTESCCVVYVEADRVRWARPSRRFEALDDAIWRGRKVNELTLASQHAAGNDSEHVQTVEASAWLRTNDAARQRITEFCWSMPSDGASLSLLWLHQ
jgi:Zn-dependent peptidase ImmA (M78 family)